MTFIVLHKQDLKLPQPESTTATDIYITVTYKLNSYLQPGTGYQSINLFNIVIDTKKFQKLC
jgi:hypothetical protein